MKSRPWFPLALVLAIPATGGLVVLSCSDSSRRYAIAQAAPAPPPVLLTYTGGISGGASPTPSGGGANEWTASTIIAADGRRDFYPNRALVSTRYSGSPYSGTVRIQTVDVNVMGSPGVPLQGGDLVCDLEWVFEVGAAFPGLTNINVLVLQQAVVTIPIDAGTINDKTVSFSGVVPSPPMTPDGLQTTAIHSVRLLVNGATTAQGQAAVLLDLEIG